MKKYLFLFSFILISALAFNAQAKIQTKTVNYNYAGTTQKGYLAWDDSIKEKRPGILVVHEIWGLNDYAKRRTMQLAQLGYVAFAADLYGNGKVGKHPEEAKEMMAALQKNQELWLGRTTASLKTLKDLPQVDATHLAAIGYCFGGATVLNLAYAGEDLKAVVSFHGALPLPQSTEKIKSKILILHGANDPHISSETIQSLKSILDQGKVDYQFISYPGAVHGFTVKEADSLNIKGVAYNAEADQKSWEEMKRLFQNVLGQ